VSEQEQEFGIERCTCGKLKTEIHCPKCGRAHYKGMPSLSFKTLDKDGNEYMMPVYRCKPCMHIFTEFQWQNQCKAKFNPRNIPGFSTAKRQVKVTHDDRIKQMATPVTELDEVNANRKRAGQLPLTQEELDIIDGKVTS